MIKVIIGPKGSGKTSRLVNDLNAHAERDSDNVVCIERKARLDRLIHYRVRLVDISEYPTHGFRELLSFISGLCAKDYDITHIYIDSIYKVAGESDPEALDNFLQELDQFTQAHDLTVTILLSATEDDISDTVNQYAIMV
ncbi:hypothetical protein HCH52_07910 [Oscillospiraceae bacterium HV4-5-C5C]|nr:hypothetical protein [Oscillospiraceae bacterium HV4-5-C5C]